MCNYDSNVADRISCSCRLGRKERKTMQDKVILSNHIGIDITFWMCLMFVMPMMFFLGGLCSWNSGLEEGNQVVLHGLSKGMLYCNIFITLLYIGAKKL